MNTVKIMILRLEGVLQSWGEQSRWNYRDTGDIPTKSGVIGLLGCAMGIPRKSPELRELALSLSVSLRVDRHGGVMMDFHTVHGNGQRIRKADGGYLSADNPLVTNRYYLEDGCYTAFITGKEELMGKCFQALNDPVWIPFLGRKCCPPAFPLLPVMTGEYTCVEEAMGKYFWKNPPVRNMDQFLQAELEDPAGAIRKIDMPVCSCQYEFAERRVRRILIRKVSDKP